MFDHIPKDFLVKDVHSADGKGRHIILARPDQLECLASKIVWYMDGTFSVSRILHANDWQFFLTVMC